MAVAKSDWVPQIGEIAWIAKSLVIPSGFSEVPDDVTAHFPLVIHISPGEDATNRYVWFLVLHGTYEDYEEEDTHVHFQYKYKSKDGRSIKEHDHAKCTSDCKKLLFLRPHGNEATQMNMAGYVDTSTVYELPLYCFHEKPGRSWHLRDCSFDLIVDTIKDAIADRLAQWRPRLEAQVLCQRLDSSQLQIDDLLCWVQTSTKRLVDSNGTSYAGFGPCVLVGTSMGTARIHVILDKRKSKTICPRFVELGGDANIITALITSSLTKHADDTWAKLSLPRGSMREFCIQDQYVVLEPAFEVSTDDLYALPSCYLPHGTTVRVYMRGHINDFAQLFQTRFAACVKERASRDADRNRVEKNRQEKELKDRRRKIQGDKDHEELLRKAETGAEMLKVAVVALSKSLVEGRFKTLHGRTPERTAMIVDCLESYLLMCAALAGLKHEGARPSADDGEAMTSEQKRRADLATAMQEMLTDFERSLTKTHSNASLREALGSTAERCDPLVYLTHPSSLPTWEHFRPKEIGVVKSKTTKLPLQNRGLIGLRGRVVTSTSKESVQSASGKSEGSDSSVADLNLSTACNLQ